MSRPRSLLLDLASRYLRGRRSRLLRGTAWAAFLSTSLGVAAMVIAMALMTGYSEDLQRKLAGGDAAIVVYPLRPLEQEALQAVEERIAAEPEVAGVQPVAYAEGSLGTLDLERSVAVTLRGVEPRPSPMVRDGASLADRDGAMGVVVGKELAAALGVEIGEVLRLIAVDQATRFHYLRVVVTEIFDTGFSETDSKWVLVDRARLQEVAGVATLLEVSVAQPRQAVSLAARLRDELADFLVSDWREYNRQLFTALRLQKIALFLVLGLIVVVSTFNVASSLVVLTRERTREIGVLLALGLSPRRVRRLFVLCGAVLGAVGALGGALFGIVISWLLTTFEIIHFGAGVAEIYFLSSVAFRVRFLDVVTILGFTFVATLVACWLPARRAARLVPSAALRYQ